MPSAATGAADATIRATAIMSCFIFVSFEAGLSGGRAGRLVFDFNDRNLALFPQVYQ